MNRKLVTFITIVGIVSLILTAINSQAKQEPMARKIVVFKSGVLGESAKETLIAKFGGVKVKDLKLIEGKAVLLPEKAKAALSKESGVLRIDDDVEVYALERVPQSNARFEFNKIKDFLFRSSQTLPWGIDRIDAERVWSITTANSIKVAIMDTGIDLGHPDLKTNIKGGYNAVNPRKSANDDNGHGTHVAGIAAAINNTIGVVGVGPQIDLYAVKVLNAAGSGYLSDIIEGLDWVVAQKNTQGGDWVVNMSLGASVDVQSFHDAIQRANNAGIVQVAAAGNSGGAVSYPAAYPEVIAVSATDQNDALAPWSSRGTEVDLSAPGVNIYSTYKGSTYKTLSGTSMAAPYVAGAAALVLSVPAKCEYLLDSVSGCSPAEVQQRLEATAEDLGIEGRDNLYGSGMVDAEKAVVF